MAFKQSVNRVNQIFPDNKLRSNQSQVDSSLTSAELKKALSKPAKTPKSTDSLASMIARQK